MTIKPVLNLENFNITELSYDYTRSNYIHLPQLVSADHTSTLLETTRGLPTKKVVCGIPDISWLEQKILPGHLAHELFETKNFIQFIRKIIGHNTDELGGISVWTSIYGKNEYINPHTDRSGTTQIILCIKSTGDMSGGKLFLEMNNEKQGFALSPGDAILFKASTIVHYTTPVLATESCLNPERIVLVARYYFG